MIVALTVLGVLVVMVAIAVTIAFTVTSPTPSKLRHPVSDDILPCNLSFRVVQPHEELVAGAAPMKGGMAKLTPRTVSMELAGAALRSAGGSLLTLWGCRRPAPLALARDTSGNIPVVRSGSQAPGFVGLSGVEAHEAAALRRASGAALAKDRLATIDIIPIWLDMTFDTTHGERRVRVCTCDTPLAPSGIARLGDVQLYRGKNKWNFLDIERRVFTAERPTNPLRLTGVTNYLDDGIYTDDDSSGSDADWDPRGRSSAALSRAGRPTTAKS